jgi:hypothetical protein
MTAAKGHIARKIGVGLAGLLMTAALPMTAFAATPVVTHYTMSPGPIATASSLAASSTVSITVSAETATNSLVPGAIIYLSFTQALGGGTASVGATSLATTPVAFTAASGTVTVTYNAPAVLPTSGRDTIEAADAKSLPTITTTDSYDYAAPINYVLSPDPIAAPVSLAAGATVSITLMAENASAVAIPNATVYLSFVPSAGGGSAAVGTTSLTGTPAAFVVGPTGQLVISYQVPIALPATGVDSISAQQTPTGTKKTDNYSFGTLKSLAFSPSPIAAAGSLAPGQTVTVTLSATDGTANPVAGQALYLTFVPVANGGSAMFGTKALSATPIQVKTDAAGLVAIRYTASSVAPSVGPDTLTAGNSKTSPTLSATDTYTGVLGATSGATYHPITPARLLDTRVGNGLSGKLSANTPASFQISGRGGVPSNATAVTGNVTVTGETDSWAIYVGPDPIAYPTTSTLNFVKGDIKANGVTVALSATGSLSATYMSFAGNTTDLIFDVTGYFTPDTSGATYHPMAPARLLDTRVGNGLSGALSANTPATFQVTGRGGIPSNATAVSGNLTVVDSTFSWAVYLGPDPIASPTTSTINFNTAQIEANNLTVALSATGTLSATYMSTAGNTTDLVFDVTGYYTADSTGVRYVPLIPARVLDTRAGTSLTASLSANTPAIFQVATRGGVPSSATGVTGNVTVVNETSSWAVFVGPIPSTNPSTSTVNFSKGDIASNGLTVALGSGGTLSATYMSFPGNTTDLIFDVTGYFVP